MNRRKKLKNRIYLTGRRYFCPNCGMRSGLEICYGYPSGIMMDLAGRGDILLGGCMVDISNPDIGCLNCSHRWKGKTKKWYRPGPSIKIKLSKLKFNRMKLWLSKATDDELLAVASGRNMKGVNL